MARGYATVCRRAWTPTRAWRGVSERLREIGMRAAVAAPILVDGRLWGAVAAGSATEPFDAESETRLGAFAELVAQAIANVDARLELRRSRARIVEAADEARRRIERDLHDGAQSRLVCSRCRCGSRPARRSRPRPRRSRSASTSCAPHWPSCASSPALHPAVLTERGLVAALEMLATRSPVPVVLEAEVPERLPAGVETALYFVAAEALTNVAKYAQPTSVAVTVLRGDRWAEVEVADDGSGGARADDGTGLRGLADRVEALGGELHDQRGAAPARPCAAASHCDGPDGGPDHVGRAGTAGVARGGRARRCRPGRSCAPAAGSWSP